MTNRHPAHLPQRLQYAVSASTPKRSPAGLALKCISAGVAMLNCNLAREEGEPKRTASCAAQLHHCPLYVPKTNFPQAPQPESSLSRAHEPGRPRQPTKKTAKKRINRTKTTSQFAHGYLHLPAQQHRLAHVKRPPPWLSRDARSPHINIKQQQIPPHSKKQNS